MPGWMKQKLESRLLGKISVTSDTTLMAESEEELKSLLMKVKVGIEKAGLKFSMQKAKIMASGHKGSVICISEVIDISPGNLDSSFCFIQPGISHDVLCI